MRLMTQRRNSDFIALCNSLTMQRVMKNPFPTVDNVIRLALRHNAPRYYVDIDTAADVINGILKEETRCAGKNVTLRRQMWFELIMKLNRMGGIRGQRVHRPILAYLLKNAQASSFFITPAYARSLYFNAQRENLRRSHIRHQNSSEI